MLKKKKILFMPIGILLVLFLLFLNATNSYSNVQSTQELTKPPTGITHSSPIAHFTHTTKSPQQFFHDGGRSFVFIAPDLNVTNATRGSSVQIALTLTHEAGSNPLQSVNVYYVGVMNHVVPNSTPP